MKRVEGSAEAGAGKRRRMSVGGWVCVAILFSLVLGLVVAYETGHERAGFLFGMALMAFLPLAFGYAVVEAVVSRVRKPR